MNNLVRFDEHGFATLNDRTLHLISGGAIVITAQLVTIQHPVLHYSVNAVCPSAAVPGPVDWQVNTTCGGPQGNPQLNPTNVGCLPSDPGTNPVCFANAIC